MTILRYHQYGSRTRPGTGFCIGLAVFAGCLFFSHHAWAESRNAGVATSVSSEGKESSVANLNLESVRSIEHTLFLLSAPQASDEDRLPAMSELYGKRRTLDPNMQSALLTQARVLAENANQSPIMRTTAIRAFTGVASLMLEQGDLTGEPTSTDVSLLVGLASNGEEDAGVRSEAIRACGELDISEAIPVLVDILANPVEQSNPGIARSACLALGRLESARAVPALSDVLGTANDESIFGTAAFALGTINDAEAMKVLVVCRGRFPDTGSCDNALVGLDELVLNILVEHHSPYLPYAIEATRSLWRPDQRKLYIPLLRRLLLTASTNNRKAAAQRLIEAASTLPFDAECDELREILVLLEPQAKLQRYVDVIQRRLSATLLQPSSKASFTLTPPPAAVDGKYEINSINDCPCGNLNSVEYGDAGYGILIGEIWPPFFNYNYNHTGIFAGRRLSDGIKRVINAQQQGVVEQNWSTIASTGPYYGSYTLAGLADTLSFYQRRDIVRVARELADANVPYVNIGLSSFLPALDYFGSTFDGTVSDIEGIRCDGVVEYSYERNLLPVWWNTSYPSSQWNITRSPDVDTHNDTPDITYNPDRELSPWAQRGAPGYDPSPNNTNMTQPSIIKLPTLQVTVLAGPSYADVTVTATDESGIHRIGYEVPGESSWQFSPRQPQHPTSPTYSYTKRVNSEGWFYYYAEDNGGNYPAFASGIFVQFASPVATPSFSPGPGTYTAPVNVTVTTSTSGATIHYTTNGSEPTESSPTYSSPVNISTTTELRAKAYKSGWTPSNTQSGTYTISQKVATPSFSPGPGTYTAPVNVTVTTSTSGATIHYTTNGSEPTESSPTYTGPIAISSTGTVKAKAYKSGWTPSNTQSGLYTIGSTQWIYNPATGHEYRLSIPGTWLQAKGEAIANDAHLATIENVDEHLWLTQNVVAGNLGYNQIWIGFNDAASEGSWMWSNGATVAFTYWAGGEPNNAGGNEDYAAIDKTRVGWQWVDLNGNSVLPGVMERPRGGGCSGAPSTPTGVGARPGSSSGQVILSWNAVGGSNSASGYKIHYDEDTSNPPFTPSHDGSPASGSNVGNVTQVTISGLTPGATYYFAVTSYNDCSESGYSTQDAIVVPGSCTGCIQVKIKPRDAKRAGGQWRVDGGAWQRNKAIVCSLSQGQHLVEFKPLTGWRTPSSRPVVVQCGQTIILKGKYSR